MRNARRRIRILITRKKFNSTNGKYFYTIFFCLSPFRLILRAPANDSCEHLKRFLCATFLIENAWEFLDKLMRRKGSVKHADRSHVAPFD